MARLRSVTSTLALGFTLAVAAPAYAADDIEGIGTATDPNIDENDNDNPNAAEAETTREEDTATRVVKKPRTTKATFPVEMVQRPMTLPENTAEVALDVPIFFGGSVDDAETDAVEVGARATQVLRAAYGVTQDLQVGVSYGFGAERLNPPDELNGYEPGKAFSIDGAYTLLPDHLAVSLSLPFYADPFAMSMSVGLPFRVNFTDTFALVGGQDIIELSFNKWPVRTWDPEYNLDQAARDFEGATPFSRGAVNIQFGALVQLKKDVAFSGWTRIHVEDFDTGDMPVPLFAGIIWSKWNLDLGARLGFARLDEGSSFGVALSAAYRL